MDYKKYYEDNKSEIIKTLNLNGYTPHLIVSEAYKDNIDVFEYIYLLYNI